MKRPGPATVGMVALVVGLTAQQIRLSQSADEIAKVLRLAEADHQILGQRIDERDQTIGGQDSIIKQLTDAIIASQAQVRDLGGEPIPVVVTAPPTTTTTTVPPEKGKGGSPTTGSASGPDPSFVPVAIAMDIYVEGAAVVTVPQPPLTTTTEGSAPTVETLPTDTTLPPGTTLPPIVLPPIEPPIDITIPPGVTFP